MRKIITVEFLGDTYQILENLRRQDGYYARIREEVALQALAVHTNCNTDTDASSQIISVNGPMRGRCGKNLH